MNKTEINLEIPMGYRIVEKTEKLDLYSACDKLRSRKQKYITSAERTGDSAILTSHRVKCPHCGYEIPAYAHYVSECVQALPKKSEAEIANWADIQLSMVSVPDEVLSVQIPEVYSGEYICEKCGFSSEKINSDVQLSIVYDDKKLYVRRIIKNLADLISVRWLTGAENISFPMCEQVVFDFESSDTYLQIFNGGQVICTASVTDSEIDLEDDILVGLFSKNKILKRTVKRISENMTGYKIPFTLKELDFYKFVNFVRFTGFPKDFYATIPFWGGTNIIDESFSNITEKLNTPENAMKLLKESSIPFCKSVKRLFAKQSGLFFYIKECEFIFGLFNDVNLFCSFLNKTFVIHFLSMMHYYEYPLRAFLTDYSQLLCKSRFAQKIRCSDAVVDYAIYYTSLSGYVRKKEQKKWLNGVDVFEDCSAFLHKNNNISVPLPLVTADMKDCLIDKYWFKYLRTKQECVVAGQKMKNCLVNWDSHSNPVVVVCKDNKMIAAVEIFNNRVFQARAKGNNSILPHSAVYNIIEKWCARNKIGFDPEELDGPFMR